MNFQRALKDPRLMKALTGLSPHEFAPLVEVSAPRIVVEQAIGGIKRPGGAS